MTLVAAYRTKDEIYCVSDTRLTAKTQTPGELVVITDVAAKLFVVPIRTTSVVDEVEEKSSFSCGFAYAGSTLSALATHSTASSCTQMLSSFSRLPAPSLRSIATLYANVGIEVLKNFKFNFPNGDAEFIALIFGFCPRTSNPNFFILESIKNAVPANVSIQEFKLPVGRHLVFGSGKDTFKKAEIDLINSGQNADFFSIVKQALLKGGNKSVSEVPQILVARRNGLKFVQILAPNESRDGLTTKVNGVDLGVIKQIDGYNIGSEAQGFDIEDQWMARALKEKGLDPNDTQLKPEEKNLAVFEYLLRMLDGGYKPGIGGNYKLSAVTPSISIWYIATKCARCGKIAPVCSDPNFGKYPTPFQGPGAASIQCWHCKKEISATAPEMFPFQWNLPN